MSHIIPSINCNSSAYELLDVTHLNDYCFSNPFLAPGRNAVTNAVRDC